MPGDEERRPRFPHPWRLRREEFRVLLVLVLEFRVFEDEDENENEEDIEAGLQLYPSPVTRHP